MTTTYPIARAKKLNIIFDQWIDASGDAVCFRVYIGHRDLIPPQVYEAYFQERLSAKLLRWVLRWAARVFLFDSSLEFRSRVCRIPAEKADDENYLFSWKVEKAFEILRESGFHLRAQENDGAFWTPCGVFCHLVKLGRIHHSMPVILMNRQQCLYVLLDSSEAERNLYPPIESTHP